MCNDIYTGVFCIQVGFHSPTRCYPHSMHLHTQDLTLGTSTWTFVLVLTPLCNQAYNCALWENI